VHLPLDQLAKLLLVELLKLLRELCHPFMRAVQSIGEASERFDELGAGNGGASQRCRKLLQRSGDGLQLL